MRVNLGAGFSPSGDREFGSVSACSCKPATRTIKNSSRFVEKIERNFNLSRRGIDWSRPSSRTRALNSIQPNSRLNRRSFTSSEKTPGPSGQVIDGYVNVFGKYYPGLSFQIDECSAEILFTALHKSHC